MRIIDQSVEVIRPRTLEEGIDRFRCIEIAGRNCWRSEEKITEDSYRRFLETLRTKRHESPMEFGDIMYVITTSRDVMAELTRHRLASFCLSGDTVISYDGKNKGRTIRELYEKQTQYQHLIKLRSVDESDKQIVLNPVNKVFYNGIKPTYTVTTNDGYQIRATQSHRFLTTDGWKELKDIAVGDRIYTNGIEAYKQPEWLNQKYNVENLSQSDIASLCGVTHHTIRAWIRKFNLQKPLGSWSIGKEPPNKGKTKDDYPPMMKTSISQLSRWRDPNLVGHVGRNKPPIEYYYGELSSASNGYTKVNEYYHKTNVCAICGETSDKTEIHHIDKNPKNFTPENMIELCMLCHKRMHFGPAVKAVKPSIVKEIAYYGEEDVYDIEMSAPYHNYVANGFVVHNCIESQRYVNESKGEGGIKFIRPLFYKEFDPYYSYNIMQDKAYEASRKWDDAMELAEDAYNQLIDMGMKNQDARKVLPNSTACKIIMKVNLRELLHIYDLRSSPAAYPEMRELMRLLKIETDKVLPGFLPEKEVNND